MDSFEWNKIAAAGLIAIMLVVVIRIVGEKTFHTEQAPVAGMPAETETVVETAAAPGPSLEVLLAAASAEKGSNTFRKCQSCHINDRSGQHKIGPNLWGVVGSTPGQKAGFSYSAAISGKGGSWTFEALDAFLASPQGNVPGTKMSFAGVRDAVERANLIAFLNAQSDSPLALPAAPLPEAPVEGEAESGQPTN